MGNPVATNDVVQVRCWSVAGDQAAVNTLYVKALSDDSGTLTDQDIANIYNDGYVTNLIPLLADPAEYRGVECRIMKSPQPGAVFANTGAGNGTGGTITLPRAVGGLIRFGTAFGGRQYKGRNYIPFPSVDAVTTDGQMAAGYATKLATLALAISGDVFPLTTGPAGFATVHQVIVHHQTKKGAKEIPPAAIPDPTFVTTWTVSGRFVTQHRRGDFGKTNTSPI